MFRCIFEFDFGKIQRSGSPAALFVRTLQIILMLTSAIFSSAKRNFWSCPPRWNHKGESWPVAGCQGFD